MKAIFFNSLFILVLILTSCGSIIPVAPVIRASSPTIPPSVSGVVKIPLELDLTPYFREADKALDQQFSGKEEQCKGVSFQYKFKRDPLVFSGKEATLTSTIQGAYSIKANYCAQCTEIFGSDPFCITPRIYVSCGDDEPMRRISILFDSQLKLMTNYQLISQTKLKKVNIIDPCQFTFLNYDASKLIENEMTNFLRKSEKEIDHEISKLDLKTPLSEVWKAIQSPISIEPYGFLYFRPDAVGLADLEFKDNKVLANLEMSVSPLFSTNPLSLNQPNLPPLRNLGSKDEFNLPVLTLASYDSLNSALSANLVGIIIPFKKKGIVIQSAEIIGPVDSKILMKATFLGSKKGTLYLLGTPVYDTATQMITFPDLEFDIQTKDALLKSAKWLFDKKVTDLLREKAKYAIGKELDENRKNIEKSLNQKIDLGAGKKANLKGKLNKLELLDIQVGSAGLELNFSIKGKLSLSL
jgi:hypothetical protein